MKRDPKIISFDKDTMDQVKALRNDEGLKWSEIAESMEMTPGKAMQIYACATVKRADKIKDATGKDIKRLRDAENLSWGEIVARVSYAESACRSLYEDETGATTKGNRIGKGGRFPNGEGGESKTPAKKTAAKKSAAAKPKAAPKSALAGKTGAEIKAELPGYAIKVTIAGKDEKIAVKSVTKASKTAIALVDSDGKARTVKTATVTAVSKSKVL